MQLKYISNTEVSFSINILSYTIQYYRPRRKQTLIVDKGCSVFLSGFSFDFVHVIMTEILNPDNMDVIGSSLYATNKGGPKLEVLDVRSMVDTI